MKKVYILGAGPSLAALEKADLSGVNGDIEVCAGICSDHVEDYR
jgi:hypothetical protein